MLSPWCPSGKAFSVGLLASAVSYLLQSQAWRPAGGGKLRLAAQVREGPYLARLPRFPLFLRVFTVSTTRFQRAPSRKEWPRDSGKGVRTPFLPSG